VGDSVGSSVLGGLVNVFQGGNSLLYGLIETFRVDYTIGLLKINKSICRDDAEDRLPNN
jgi:hypothetical protein